ncbi:hypothetical protein T06_14421 [Trichinella sp. T6]|nr:hypothetical protein T06_14421 [Trichinella sp. T6]
MTLPLSNKPVCNCKIEKKAESHGIVTEVDDFFKRKKLRHWTAECLMVAVEKAYGLRMITTSKKTDRQSQLSPARIKTGLLEYSHNFTVV